VASGNVDDDEQSGFPSEVVIELAGRRIAIRHVQYEGGKLTRDGRAFLDHERPDICIFDHTHQPRVEWFGKTLLFNFGSAGPQRFTLPRSMGCITIDNGTISTNHIALESKTQSRQPRTSSQPFTF